MIVSTAQLRLKSVFKLLPALRLSASIIKEMQKAPGFRGHKAGPRGLLTLCTITLWDSEEAMMHFVRSGTHLEAMKQTASLARSARATHWQGDSLPTWKEAAMQLEKS